MRHPIDPKIDCVFKALLGAEAKTTVDRERAEKEAVLQRVAAALAEIERLRRWLADQSGV